MIELRPYREDDRRDFVALVTDPAVMRAMGGPLTLDAAAALFDAFVQRAASNTIFAAAAVEGGSYVGHGFLVRRQDPPGVELGFIVTPAHRNRGCGTAIARDLARRGFEELGLARIIATVDEDNVASIRVLGKAGFEDLGSRHDDDGPYRFFALTATRPDG